MNKFLFIHVRDVFALSKSGCLHYYKMYGARVQTHYKVVGFFHFPTQDDVNPDVFEHLVLIDNCHLLLGRYILTLEPHLHCGRSTEP